MSKLFFKVSWAHNIEKFRSLQQVAKKQGFGLVVRNISRTRGVPIFLFFLDRKDGSEPVSFSSLDEVECALAKQEVAA